MRAFFQIVLVLDMAGGIWLGYVFLDKICEKFRSIFLFAFWKDSVEFLYIFMHIFALRKHSALRPIKIMIHLIFCVHIFAPSLGICPKYNIANFYPSLIQAVGIFAAQFFMFFYVFPHPKFWTKFSCSWEIFNCPMRICLFGIIYISELNSLTIQNIEINEFWMWKYFFRKTQMIHEDFFWIVVIIFCCSCLSTDTPTWVWWIFHRLSMNPPILILCITETAFRRPSASRYSGPRRFPFDRGGGPEGCSPVPCPHPVYFTRKALSCGGGACFFFMVGDPQSSPVLLPWMAGIQPTAGPQAA